jgi:aspartyl/glutamyl-tRNA(Asn/Gln) amidotransferase C subunit
VIEVEDDTWQRQLNALSRHMVWNLEQVLGKGMVEDVEFRVVPRRREPQRAPAAVPALFANKFGRRIGRHRRPGDAQHLSGRPQKGTGVKITEKEVRYVAGLANLQLSEAEVAKLQSDLNGILEHMDKLKEIDTTGVEPMAQVLFERRRDGNRAGRCAGTAARKRGLPWPMRRNRAPDISKCPR